MSQSRKIDVGHLFAAGAQRGHAILRLAGGELQFFENAARDGADHAAVIDDQTLFHGQNISRMQCAPKRQRTLPKPTPWKVNKGFPQ